MTGNSALADAVVQAAAVARALHGRPVVVKLGGSAMEEPAATRGALECVAALQSLGVRVVLVHGGGKPIDRAMAAAGLVPRKVAGRRYTDDATLKIVFRVLFEICDGLLERLREIAGRGACGETAAMFAERLTLTDADGQVIDLGHVGRITRVDTAKLVERLEYYGVVVIPSLALTAAGPPRYLNVNADTAASAVAGALNAAACYFLTDTPGVLRDIREPASLIPRLTVSECRELIAAGVIAGGMIPKVEACFEAIAAGAGKAVILDGRDPRALLGEFVSDCGSGTAVVP